jgi:hypothetical protein
MGRTRSTIRQIAAVKDKVGRGLPKILKHGLKGRSVAVDVTYDGDPH